MSHVNIHRMLTILLTIITSNALDTEVSAGIFWKPLPDTIIYEASFPLTYKMQWDTDEIQIFDTNETCPNHTNFYCQFDKQFHQVNQIYINEQKRLQKSWYISEFHSIIDNHKKRHQRVLDFIGKGLEWCCGVATQQKLASLTTNEKQAEAEIRQLHEGLKHNIDNVVSIINHFDEYQNKVANTFNNTNHKLLQIEKWVLNISKNIEENNDEALKIVIRNQFTLLKSPIRTTRDIRKERIIRECRTNKIPSEVIQPRRLSKDLWHLSTHLQKFDQGLAIPMSDFARYYQVDISECIFTQNSPIVHIKIPIRPNLHNWKLYELITAPFAWYNNTCMIEHNPLYLAVSSTSKADNAEHRQISGSRFHYCTPFNNKLCYLPRYAGDQLQGPACASTIFKGVSVEEISQQRHLRCKKTKHLTITKVEDETFILTHPSGTTKIMCDKEVKEITNDEQHQIGALKIQLPCNCILDDDNYTVIPERYPCPDTLKDTTIHHIIPAIWTTLTSYVLNIRKQTTPVFKNITEHINHNWIEDIPHENLTSAKQTATQLKEAI